MTFLSVAVVILCALAMAVEGFDAYSISYVGPFLVKLWGLPATLLGFLFAAGVAASACGATVGGPLADRYGRKRMLVLAILLFGVMSVASAGVSGITSLIVARVVAGIGLGTSVPAALALACEAVPLRHRSVVTTLMAGSIGLGLVGSSLTAAATYMHYGPVSLLYLGGGAALVIGIIIAAVLPESASFTALDHAPLGRNSVKARIVFLFSPEHRASAIVGTIVLTLIYGVSYFFNFWLPMILLGLRSDIRGVALATALVKTTSIFGSVTVGSMMDRRGPVPALGVSFALAAVALSCGVAIPKTYQAMVVGFCIASFFMDGAFGGALALPAALFPTELRASALGFQIGIGRLVGGVLGPLLGGFLMARNPPVAEIAILFSVPLLIAAAALGAVALRSGTR